MCPVPTALGSWPIAPSSEARVPLRERARSQASVLRGPRCPVGGLREKLEQREACGGRGARQSCGDQRVDLRIGSPGVIDTDHAQLRRERPINDSAERVPLSRVGLSISRRWCPRSRMNGGYMQQNRVARLR